MLLSTSPPKNKPIPNQNWMHPIQWIPAGAASLLDVGCNAGELLGYCREWYPTVRLTGVDVNSTALKIAREKLPDADIKHVGAESLPFDDASFDCVTCIEVLEHIPSHLRSNALREIHRVLRPNGRFVLRVPHAGWFDWLDAANFRFRLPGLYNSVVKRGRRDDGYQNGSEGVVWHHHFTMEELLQLLGEGWELENFCRGGLFLFPLMDIACWPFYRTKQINTAVFRGLMRVMDFDLGIDYGSASFDMLLVLRRN